MALINCPECNHEVSTFAEVCPNCGFPINKLDAIDISQWSKDKKLEFAYNSNCPLSILEKLADDPNEFVRKAVAKNPNCPEIDKKRIDSYFALSNEEKIKIASGELKNSEYLNMLISDSDWKVRREVAKNPNCPAFVLEKLANDPFCDKILGHMVRTFVVENRNCSSEILEKLSMDSDKWVRGSVTKNPNCPADILKKLANDSDKYVRCSVAKNPNCPEYILKKLSTDCVPLVCWAVAENPNCPVDIRDSINDKLSKIDDPAVALAKGLKNS